MLSKLNPISQFPNDGRQICRYGADCFQRNPEHHQKFSHPATKMDVAEEKKKDAVAGWTAEVEAAWKNKESSSLSMYGYGNSSDPNLEKAKKVQAAVDAATNAIGEFEGGGDVSDPTNDRRPECKHGVTCHQKNPEHKVMFKHPPGWFSAGAATALAEKATPWSEPSFTVGRTEGGKQDHRRPDCRNGAGCTQPNPEHKQWFSHPPGWDPAHPVRDQEDKRGLCKWGADCKQKNPEHQVMFKHPPGWTIDKKKGATDESSSVTQYYQEHLRQYQQHYPGCDPAKMTQYHGYGNRDDSSNGSSDTVNYQQQWMQWQQWQQWQQQQQYQQQKPSNVSKQTNGLPPPPPRQGMLMPPPAPHSMPPPVSHGIPPPQTNRMPPSHGMPPPKSMLPHRGLPPPPPPPMTNNDDSWNAEVDKRPSCHHGIDCHQRNPEHAEMFRHHPSWNSNQLSPNHVQSKKKPEHDSKLRHPALGWESKPPPEQTRNPKDNRPPCKYGEDCPNLENDHQVMFWHPEPTGPGGMSKGAAMEYYRKHADYMPEEFKAAIMGKCHANKPAKDDRRPFCRYGMGCKHSNEEHKMMFQHPPGWIPPLPLPEAEPIPPGLEEEIGGRKGKRSVDSSISKPPDGDSDQEGTKKLRVDTSSES